MGRRYKLSVATANMPVPSPEEAVEPEDESPLVPLLVLLLLLFLLARTPKMAPTTAAAITTTATGMPILIHLLVPFLGWLGVMKPVDSL